ncbi:hypothetical protein ES765_01905 [Maribacter sp. ACAM166]|nr:hypothetical protein ES765_01905 [Maribacter sp. ACAM166]
MISCEKAACICNKAQYKEASIWSILKLRFHLLLCKTCSKHSQRNNKLTSLCDKANFAVLSEEDKEKMKESLPKKN